MIRALWMITAVAAVLFGLYATLGFWPAFELGYGMMTILAVTLSVTFLWLYVKKLTPLAMGMAVSWAGVALVIGWWWVFNLLDKPMGMYESPVFLGFLAVYLVGALLHMASLERALNWGVLPVLGYLGLAFAASASLMVVFL